MNIERPTSNFEQMKKHALEVVGVIWLVIVAVQYVGRYFLGIDLDLKLVYVGMLALTIVVAVWRATFGRGRIESCPSGPEGGRDTRPYDRL